MPAALAQHSEAGPYQRSLGHLQLPHPTRNLRLLPPPPPAFSKAENLIRSQLSIPVSPTRKAPASLLSDYALSLTSYHSPRTSVGWDSRAVSPLCLVQPVEAPLAHSRIFPHPGSALLSPVPSQIASPPSLLDMDPRYPLTRRPDDPIEDLEWVYVFADILRQARDGGYTARLASQVLFDNIQQIRYQPSWDEVSLPGGRNLRSIQDAYQVFSRTGPGVPPPQPPKRPLQMDAQTPIGRPIAPKPPLAGPTGALRTLPSGSPTTMSPLAGSSSTQPEPRRKRGRPSKRETEERRLRQSEARTSVDLTGVAPLLSTRTFGVGQYGLTDVPPSPATSAPAAVSTAGATPRATSQDPSSNGSGSGGKKRPRGRPPKNPQQTNLPPPTFNPSGGSRDKPLEQEITRGGTVQSPRSTEPTSAKTTDAEESKQQKWKDTILNE